MRTDVSGCHVDSVTHPSVTELPLSLTLRFDKFRCLSPILFTFDFSRIHYVRYERQDGCRHVSGQAIQIVRTVLRIFQFYLSYFLQIAQSLYGNPQDQKVTPFSFQGKGAGEGKA